MEAKWVMFIYCFCQYAACIFQFHVSESKKLVFMDGFCRRCNMLHEEFKCESRARCVDAFFAPSCQNGIECPAVYSESKVDFTIGVCAVQFSDVNRVLA
jgi:hypothetical protein